MSAGDEREVLVVLRRLLSEWGDGPPGRWENQTIPAYLEAMAAWLESYEQSYINTGKPVPADGWTIFAHALQAATIYE